MKEQSVSFNEFFKELNGHPPFPWQSRLAKHVIDNGWPQTIDIPTGAGKTSVIDIAIFHLALEANKPPAERLAPMRIFFVVDRRIVVDEAFLRAKNIAEKLKDATNLPENSPLVAVAKALKAFVPENDSKPLDVVRLRGGLYRERAFIQNPFQPTVILSTVDQIGSRLLFRGYGVSQFMRPVHAALVGIDSLIVMDEVHLSKPFAKTLDWIKNYQSEKWARFPIGKPVIKIEMSATPLPSQDIFSLEKEDWEHEVLSKRLKCSKPVILCPVKGNKEDTETTTKRLEKELVENARSIMADLQQKINAPVVGVVANRVQTARHVFNALQEEKGKDVILLTGRMRPFDRDRLLDDFLSRMKSGRKSDDNPKPLYVVATQTIEVGANLDFNALVSEIAPLDALRQRFGRVNRLGQHESSENIVVYPDYGRSKPKEDFIYGRAIIDTAKWLQKNAKSHKKKKMIDFGIAEMNALVSHEIPEGIDKLLSPTKDAPILLPAHVDLFSQTSPPPAIDPDVSLFLHGPNTQPPDVRIVWRTDVPEALSLEDKEMVINTVLALPPAQQEVLEIPVWAARSFLAANKETPVFDVEGGNMTNTENSDYKGRRLALCWKGPDESRLVSADDVRPGDMLVVPSSYGGMDRFGWHPDSSEPVKDIAEDVSLKYKAANVLRIHKNLIPYWFDDTADTDQPQKVISDFEQMMQDYLSGQDMSLLLEEFMENLLSIDNLKDEYRDRLSSLQHEKVYVVYPTPDNPQGVLLQKKVDIQQEFSDDDDSSSLVKKNYLDDHCREVGRLAGIHGEQAGLSKPLVDVLKNAGELHDIGKADPRFQAWLFGGDRIESVKNRKLFAKSSTLLANSRYTIALARERAGYPKGCRHEAYSVAIMQTNETLQQVEEEDKDLLLYLVGVHHGRGRPFIPTADDSGIKVQFDFLGRQINFSGRHMLESLDSGWVDRFWRLIRCYGYWGLAYLETLLRLSDHICSSKGV